MTTKDPTVPELNWEQIRWEFINENLDVAGQTLTLKTLAERHGANYVTVRKHAAEGKWNDDLRRMRIDLEAEITRGVLVVQSENEIAIRVRQARFARLAQSKAIRKLESISAEKLTVNQAIELLQLGLEEERKALGMTEEYTPQEPSPIQSDKTQQAVDRAKSIIQKLKKQVGQSDNPQPA